MMRPQRQANNSTNITRSSNDQTQKKTGFIIKSKKGGEIGTSGYKRPNIDEMRNKISPSIYTSTDQSSQVRYSNNYAAPQRTPTLTNNKLVRAPSSIRPPSRDVLPSTTIKTDMIQNNSPIQDKYQKTEAQNEEMAQLLKRKRELEDRKNELDNNINNEIEKNKNLSEVNINHSIGTSEKSRAKQLSTNDFGSRREEEQEA